MLKLRYLLFYFLLGCFLVFSGCGKEEESESVPTFEILEFTVAEDLEGGGLIGTLNVTNTSTSSLTFSISSGNEQGLFELSSDGKLTLSENISLDYEESISHELMVRATDGTMILESEVLVKVSDVDENGLFIFKGSNYDLAEKGIFFSLGLKSPVEDKYTHYGFQFVLGVGKIIENEYGFKFTEIGLLWAIYLYDTQGETISDGVYEFRDGTSLSEEDISGKKFFTQVAFVLDGNNNGVVLESDDDLDRDEVYLATGGTITVTNNGDDNYTLAVDLTVAQIVFDDVDYLFNEEIIPDTERRVRFSQTSTYYIEQEDDAVEIDPDQEEEN